jgi:ABC-type phosphate transport system permease subunit
MSLLTAIFSALIGAGATLTDVFGAANGKMVLAILMLANVIISSTNTVLHAIPASIPATSQEESKFLLGPKDK